MKYTVVLVCGGRDFNRPRNRDKLWSTLDSVHAHYGELVVIVGGAPGADMLAEYWALDRGQHCARVAALWGKHGKGAGFKRNGAMAALRPDICLAFPGGPGTADMAAQARAAGIDTYEIV